MDEINNQISRPQISILVPVYNTETFLATCLTSLIDQSFRDIEIICVDDGSTDRCAEILDEFHKRDSRLKIITLAKNEGLLRARYYGIKEACGRYILFVDSDDYLETDACAVAFAAIEKYSVDILHFSTNIIPFGAVSRENLYGIKTYVTSYTKRLYGEKIFVNSFVQLRFGWNIWNKIYRAEVVKQTLDHFPLDHIVFGEDMFIFSMIVYFAHSYYGIPNSLYNYRYGSGVSTVDFTEKQFISLADKMRALANMQKFYLKVAAFDGLKKDFVEQETAGVQQLMAWHFLKSVPEKSAPACFDIMLGALGLKETLLRILNLGGGLYDTARRLIGAQTLIPKRQGIKTIALFYFDYAGGGVERVMSQLIVMFHEMGYKVVLITEKKEKNEFLLPDYCRRAVIASSNEVDQKSYMQHCQELLNVLNREDVDLVLYQSSNSPRMLYDLIAVKARGIYFAATTHDFITSPLLYGGRSFAWKPQVLRLCDAVQTITTLEETVYRKSGVNARYIPNSLTFKPDQKSKYHFAGTNIIWVGRLDNLQKNPAEILEIARIVKKYILNLQLTVLGQGTKEENENFAKRIRILGLQNNLNWIKQTAEPEVYYRQADLMVATSSYEVYPMAIGEAMSFGLPIVTYEMPYVELLKENDAGTISVEPHNIRLAAQAVLGVLTDQDRHQKLSTASKKAIARISTSDIQAKWGEFLTDLSAHHHYLSEKPDDISTFLDVVYQHYSNDKNQQGMEKISLLRNLFRYFKKFGCRLTFKKIHAYIRKNGFRAAILKGRHKLY